MLNFFSEGISTGFAKYLFVLFLINTTLVGNGSPPVDHVAANKTSRAVSDDKAQTVTGANIYLDQTQQKMIPSTFAPKINIQEVNGQDKTPQVTESKDEICASQDDNDFLPEKRLQKDHPTAVNCKGFYLKRFEANQKQTIINFGMQYLSNTGSHVLYPFGGPDITYPFLLFPSLTSLTLLGLEPAHANACCPIILSNKELGNLTSLYKRSFFITDQMAQGVDNVGAVIFKQLENLGAIDIKIEALPQKNSIQITCTYKEQKRTIRYYQQNLCNSLFNEKFMDQLLPINVVLFKAASCLPHNSNFSKFCDYVASNAATIVQDSTGIVYAKLLKYGYSVNLKGRYLKTYEFPSAAQQLDLKELSAKSNNRPLGFCFGYGCGRVPMNIVIATKNLSTTPASTALHVSTPVSTALHVTPASTNMPVSVDSLINGSSQSLQKDIYG